MFVCYTSEHITHVHIFMLTLSFACIILKSMLCRIHFVKQSDAVLTFSIPSKTPSTSTETSDTNVLAKPVIVMYCNKLE